MEYPRKTLILVAENPRQEKGTSDPEREGSKAKGTQKATKRPEDYPNRKVELKRKRGTEDAASDKNQGESNKSRQGKMPRKGNRQSRRKPHREEKRSTEANDEAHARKQVASKSTGPGSPAEGTETKS